MDVDYKSDSTSKLRGNRVLIFRDRGSERLAQVQFPHPATSKRVSFFTENGHLLEIQKVESEYRSWFIGEDIQTCGGLFIATPFDVLFLLIPILDRTRKKKGDYDGVYVCLNDMTESEADFEMIGLLSENQIEPDFSLICDTQELDGKLYVRLSDDKLFAWLKCKADKLEKKITEKQYASFLSRFPALQQHDDEKVWSSKCAFSLIAEYLNSSWKAKLCKKFGIETEWITLPPPVVADPPPKKKRNSPSSWLDRNKKKKTDSPKAGVNGQKSIMSFFK